MTSRPTLQQRPKPSVTPRGGAPGSEVTVSIAGLPPAIPVLVSFGALASGYEILARTETDTLGALDVKVKVPHWATPQDKNYFFVSPPDELTRLVSDLFHVTDAQGILRVEGRVTGVNGECTTLQGDDAQPIMLLVQTSGVAAGARVLVEGTVAEAPTCGQGLTLRVRRITPR